jgi:hypothetical protein
VTRLPSYNFRDRYVRHVNNDARIDPAPSPATDGQWRIVPGLANAASGYVSFESVNVPGHYLRHYNYDFSLARNEGTAAFADRYIRHSNYLLRLDPITDATGRADATFRVTT